jgi:hypothetical protein
MSPLDNIELTDEIKRELQTLFPKHMRNGKSIVFDEVRELIIRLHQYAEESGIDCVQEIAKILNAGLKSYDVAYIDRVLQVIKPIST